MDANTPYQMIKALQKQLAPTDQAREIEVLTRYQTLRKPPTSHGLDKWLQQWERIYTDAKKLSIFEVQKDRPLFDFLAAIKDVNQGFASNYEFQIHINIKRKETLPTLFDLIEDFWN